LFEATILMVDIARVDLAKLYLDKLMEEPLDDEVLMALREKYGAAPFLKLANVPELKPAAVKLLDMSNAAAARQASDPARIARLIADLEGEPEQKAAAEAELEALGTAVVPGLLQVIVNPELVDRHNSAMRAILRLGTPAVPLLVGALEAPEESFRAKVIALLGHLRSREAVPYLWYPALAADESPAVREAAREALARLLNATPGEVDRLGTEGTVARMLKSVREHFRQEHDWKTTGKVKLWSWSGTPGALVARQVEPDEASDIVAFRFARQAQALAPQLRSTQVMYLCLAFASDIRRTGFDKPLPTGPGTAHDVALSVGSDVALDVIAEAFNSTRPAVAAAALKVFSEIGTLTQMHLSGARRSPVLLGLDYPDPRVQFAAAAAILQIDPPSPFRGAPRVVDILKRALHTDGRAHAIIGEISTDRGAMIGGILRELGYESLVLTSGRDVFTAAADRSDVELIVLHPNMVRWPLSQTLANLRADARTAKIPVIIHGPAQLTNKMQTQSRLFQLVAFSSASETSEDFDRQLKPLLKQIKSTSLSPLERAAQREQAAAWLAHIAQGRRTKVFDIKPAEPELTDLLEGEKLAPLGLEALGEIPTRTSQQSLAELVVNTQADVELRRVAAIKLAYHIQRFGLVLKQEMIDGLHKVWRDGRQGTDLRTAVASVIGSLKPDAELAGKRLKQQPVRAP
jgi:HEAT repeat protein